MELIDHMEEMLGRNMTEQYGSGRGIVMVAGNADTLQRVRWSLEMIRSYGSKLPVQIVRSRLRSFRRCLLAELSPPVVSLSVRSASSRRFDPNRALGTRCRAGRSKWSGAG